MIAAISATLIYQAKTAESVQALETMRGRVSEHSNVRPQHNLSSNECRVDMGVVQAIDVYHSADATHYSATKIVRSACFFAIIVSSKTEEWERWEQHYPTPIAKTAIMPSLRLLSR